MLVEQVRAQDVGEQVVVAVPLPPVVERDEEQVGALERDEASPCRRSRPVTASQSGPVSRSRTDVRSRKSRTSVGLAGQHLLGEVVDDVAVVAGEPGDERAGVVAALHRQRGQLQGGDPALGALVQRRDVALGQREAHRAVEVGRGLLGGEAQVGGPHLDQLAACPHPRQRQRRVGPGGEHQVQLRRQVLEQERHPVVHLGRLDEVVVVEDQQQVLRPSVEVVEQRGERRLGRRRGRRQQLQRVRPRPATAVRIAVTT